MPLQAWTDIARSRTDTKSGLPTTLFADLENNGDHVRETVYDTGAHTGATAHDHDGANSAFIPPADFPNLIIDGTPSGEGNNDLDVWSLGGTVEKTQAITLAAANSYATHTLGQQDAARSRAMWGTGCPLVLSVFARARTPMAAVTFNFGITDGHTSTFKAGTQAVVAVGDLSVAQYRRYWTRISNFTSAGMVSSVRLGVSVSGAFTSGGRVDVTLMMAAPGPCLSWWRPAMRVNRQHNWELVGSGMVPTVDRESMFTRAMYVAPV